MKCVKCGARKGKRACPALKGDICPQCCGEYRLKEIQCPADCSWLGGLAVLAQGAASVDVLDVFRAMRSTVEACAQWTNVRANEELKLRLMKNAHALLGGSQLDEHDDWLGETLAVAIYANAVDGGQKPIEAYLEDRARDLSPAEVTAARAFAVSKTLLARVDGVPEARDGLIFLTLVDVISGDKSEACVDRDSPVSADELIVGHEVIQGGKKHVAFDAPLPPMLNDPAIALWKEAPAAPEFIRKVREIVRTVAEAKPTEVTR